MANTAGLTVILHGGGMSPYGTHLTCAMPNMPWAEFGIWPPPGVPLEECQWTPGCVLPKDSWITVNDGPGLWRRYPGGVADAVLCLAVCRREQESGSSACSGRLSTRQRLI